MNSLVFDAVQFLDGRLWGIAIPTWIQSDSRLGVLRSWTIQQAFWRGYWNFCDASAKLHWLNLYFGDLQWKFGDSGTLGAYLLCVIQCACAPFWAFCNDAFAVWWWAREPFKGVVSCCFMHISCCFCLWAFWYPFAHLSRLRFELRRYAWKLELLHGVRTIVKLLEELNLVPSYSSKEWPWITQWITQWITRKTWWQSELK